MREPTRPCPYCGANIWEIHLHISDLPLRLELKCLECKAEWDVRGKPPPALPARGPTSHWPGHPYG